MLICHCRAVHDRKIREQVLGGAQTVGQVGRATGAGTCCGGCVPAIREIVESVGRPLPVVEYGSVYDVIAAE
ncbi:MAG TPA: (2Fe-2S)-binding protein [Polyangiaceae bacterium]|nr:(2Fe-2S)-binding protein [Polyangiaceae bacterium]